jgi:tRNA-(ms[2]io[6]A)-hydroxylase
MLGLKLPTDTRWAELAQNNLPELLTDHAFCEQKAASNAISLIVRYPHLSDLVQEMAQIAQEEMAHFEEVHAIMLERGWVLGPERKDPYVNDLLVFIQKDKGPEWALMDRLLFAAMVEARSCERFRLLTETVVDEQLHEFYKKLFASEANHYATFIKLATKYAPNLDVKARWQAWLEYEAQVIGQYGTRETMHG